MRAAQSGACHPGSAAAGTAMENAGRDFRTRETFRFFRRSQMLEVVTAQAPGKCQIFFNISHAVGIASPNDQIDVELVQLGYYCAAINPANHAPPDVKATWRMVKPGAGYSGSPTDPLSQA